MLTLQDYGNYYKQINGFFGLKRCLHCLSYMNYMKDERKYVRKFYC